MPNPIAHGMVTQQDADVLVFDGDPWDGRKKVQATYVEGETVFEADVPYLPE